MPALKKLPATDTPALIPASADLPYWVYDKFRHVSTAGRRAARDPNLCFRSVAKEIGVDPSYVAHMMYGRRIPSLRVMVKLASALEMSVETLWALMQKWQKECLKRNRTMRRPKIVGSKTAKS